MEYDIHTIPADYTLEELYDKWRNRDIGIPEFERGYVWTEEQASRLIESFMMDLPVPAVFLSTGDDGRSIIIDGVQRLLTVFSYLGGSYPEASIHEGKKFRIVGINEDSRLFGKTFFDLGGEDQRRLKDAILRATLVSQNGSGGDASDMYEVFERLNTGGTPLSAQEVRNCVYAGGLNDMFREANRHGDWRYILGRPRLDPRMKDVELVLRCTALFHEGDGYAEPMKAFLSGFMARHRDAGGRFIGEERRRFEATCGALAAALGPRPFDNGRGQLRIPVLDSVFVAFARNADGGGRLPGRMKERLKALLSDREFIECTGSSSTTADAVRGRIRLAQEALFG